MSFSSPNKLLQTVVKECFKRKFPSKPMMVRAPGRVNLIGDHTDYNKGFVLPAAIDKEIIFAIAKNETDKINLVSYDINQEVSVDIGDYRRQGKNWVNYLIGVVKVLNEENFKTEGFDCCFGGNIPIGSGLSSSAAVECGLGFSLSKLFGHEIDKITLTKLAQKAENEFVGVKCGIMDQFASMYGAANHVMRLDCRSLDFEYFQLGNTDFSIVLLDTQVKHSLAESEYNTRLRECQMGVATLKKYFPEVNFLRDCTLDMIKTYKNEFYGKIYDRCEYVIKENMRVIEACNSLIKNDIKHFGKLMYLSHAGLQHQYEVSCLGLDFLVDQSRKYDNIYGARMMGGGFGGCTINLIKNENIDEIVKEIKAAYNKEFKIGMLVHKTKISNGVGLVEG